MYSNIELRNKAVQLYLLLGGLFVGFLVVCNLIANKFVTIQIPFFSDPFIISCGVLPYPLTFLITDILSEFYGRKKTSLVVFTGLIVSILIIGLLSLANHLEAIVGSPVGDETFALVFGNSWRVIGASMLAYVMAQFADVHIFHFFKGLTKGKKLWLRNNASTILSQLIDTTLVIFVLFAGVKSMGEMADMIKDGWLFKVLCALVDTPIIYLSVFLIRKFFKLQPGQEVEF